MKNLTLHIGMVKTGTTSIQGFLSLNRKLLESRGWTFPKAPGLANQTRLAAYARNPSNWNDDLFIARGIDDIEKLARFKEEFAEALRTEVEASGNENFIMSSEHCSSRLRTVAEVTTLKTLLSSMFDNIRILMYLRRQDELAASAYATSVRVGNVNKFTPKNVAWQGGLDFRNVLTPWISVFGQDAINLRLFDKRSMRGQELISDFCSVMDLTPGGEFARPPRLNPSYDESTLEFLRLMNRYIPRFEDGKVNKARGNLTEILEKISSGPASPFSDSVNRQIMHLYRESNSEILRTYFPDLPYNPFHYDDLDGAPPEEEFPKSLTTEESIEIAAKMWIAKAGA